MIRASTYFQDSDLRKACVTIDLGSTLAYIAEHYTPEDVFGTEALDAWAVGAGYKLDQAVIENMAYMQRLLGKVTDAA